MLVLIAGNWVADALTVPKDAFRRGDGFLNTKIWELSMNPVFSVLGSMVANFGALMVCFVVTQFVVCVATSWKSPKALLALFFGPIGLAPWFAILSVAGALLFDDAEFCLLFAGILGVCFSLCCGTSSSS